MSPPIGGVRAGYLSAGKDAIPDILIDNLEDSPDGPYDTQTVSDFYSGATGVFARTTNNPADGGYAIESQASENTGKAIVSLDGDGLPNYPSQGGTVGAYLRTGGSAGDQIPAYIFNAGYAGSIDCYSVSISGSDSFSLLKYESADPTSMFGGRTILSSKSPTLSSPQYYYIEVDTADTEVNIEARLYDVDSNNDPENYPDNPLSTISYQDTNTPTFESNTGIGWFARSDGTGTLGDEMMTE